MHHARLRPFGGRGDRAIGLARAATCAVEGDAVDEAVLSVTPDCRAASTDMSLVICVRD
jgi:hypothetical protein